MTLTQEARIECAPDSLDEWPDFMASCPPAQVADLLPLWLFDAVVMEQANGTFTSVRFVNALRSALDRIYTPPGNPQHPLMAEGGSL